MKNNLPETKTKIVIIGAGSHALVIADALLASNKFDLLGFAESDQTFSSLNSKNKAVTPELSFPIFSESNLTKNFSADEIKLVLGLGSHLLLARQQIATFFTQKNYAFATLVHPSAIIAPSVKLGEGTVVLAGTVLNPYVVTESHVVINTSASLDHECLIGENSFVQPGVCLAGNVTIGKNCIVGIGAIIKEGIRIGKGSIVGGGAFVNRDVPEKSLFVGIPARKIRSLNQY